MLLYEEDEQLIIDGKNTLTLHRNKSAITCNKNVSNITIRNFHFIGLLNDSIKTKFEATITALKFIWR